MPQQSAHQNQHNKVRRMNRSILIPPGRRLPRAELKFAALVCRKPSKSKWQSVRSLNSSLTLKGLLGDIIRLPDLQHRVRHRLAAAVQNPPANRHAIPFFSRALNTWSAQCGKPNGKERSNRLRRCRHVTHFIFPSELRRVRAKQYRIDTPTQSRETYSPNQT